MKQITIYMWHLATTWTCSCLYFCIYDCTWFVSVLCFLGRRRLHTCSNAGILQMKNSLENLLCNLEVGTTTSYLFFFCVNFIAVLSKSKLLLRDIEELLDSDHRCRRRVCILAGERTLRQTTVEPRDYDADHSHPLTLNKWFYWSNRNHTAFQGT